MEVDRVFGLLLQAIGAQRGPEGCPQSALADWGDAEWSELLRLADWHRLTGVLHRHLAGVESIPAWVTERLEAEYLRLSARSLMVSQTKRVVLDLLRGAEIRAMLLKGAALAEDVYADPITREMGDIDLLVREADLEASIRVLAGHGFRSEEESSAPWRHAAPLYSSDGLVPLELHRHIVYSEVDSRRFPASEVWSRSRPSLDGGPHLLPAPADLLLHLCLHFSHGRRYRSDGALAQVRDMASVIARYDIDWPLFAANARRYSMAGRAFLALYSLVELGFSVPESAMARLRPSQLDASAGQRFIAQRVLAGKYCVPATDWGLSVGGVRNALWWARRQLTSRENLHPEETPAPLTRRLAVRRLAGQVLTQPRAFLSDGQIARWMERST